MVVGVVGLTIAYFSNTSNVDNIFSTKEYGTTVTEEFVSPANWLPCTVTPKTVTVTNSGDVDEVVRISYTEKWINANGSLMSGFIDANGDLTNDTNSERVAIINFSNNGDWTYDNGYYYYKKTLEPGETTSTLTDSVTFNCKTNASQSCTRSQDGKSVVCTSTGDGYDNATYTLTFNIETMQYENHENEWDITVSEEENCNLSSSYGNNTVIYNNEEYYVIDDSKTEYATLLKKNVLTADEINTYSTNYVSHNGDYPYSYRNDCNGNNIESCYLYSPYNNSDVKTVIDGWASQFDSDLVSVNGYKARLLNENDLLCRMNIPVNGGNTIEISHIDDVPSWISVYGKVYWTMIRNDDIKVYTIGSDLYLDNIYDYYHYIRPVINVKKCVLTNTCQ